MNFRKPFDEQRVHGYCTSGSRIEPQYIERYDEHGHPYLEHTGDVNTYEKIQSFKDECDINVLMQRYAAGDESVLRPGYYIDTSAMPKTYHEYFNLMQEQKEKFSQLPLEIKNKFGNSFEEWAATAGNEEWATKMGFNEKPAEAAPAAEVIKNEQKQ